MSHTGGESELQSNQGEVTARMRMHAGPDDPEALLSGDGSETRPSVEDRLLDPGIRIRDGLGAIVDNLDRRTGIITAARDHPLAAIGFAFSVGYLLAVAGGEREESNWLVDRARRRLRTLIVGSFAALASDELRHLLGPEAPVGRLIEQWLDGSEESEDDRS